MILRFGIAFIICGFIYVPTSNTLADDNPILAKVNGFEIRFSHVQAAQKNLPQDYQRIPIEKILPRLIDNLIDTNLVVANAKFKKLDKTEEFKTRIGSIKSRYYNNYYLVKLRKMLLMMLLYKFSMKKRKQNLLQLNKFKQVIFYLRLKKKPIRLLPF